MTAFAATFLQVSSVVRSVSADEAEIVMCYRGRAQVVTCPRTVIAARDGAFLSVSPKPLMLSIRREFLEAIGLAHRGEWPAEVERMAVIRNVVSAARQAASPPRARNGARPSRTALDTALGVAIRDADEFFTGSAEAAVTAERRRCIEAVRGIDGAVEAIEKATPER